MSLVLSPIGNGFQFFGGNTAASSPNIPLSAGLLYIYSAGTTTPVTTYTTSAGTIANTNPIVLGPDGRPPYEIWWTAGANYKLVLKDTQGNAIPNASYDNIPGINDVTQGTGSANSVTFIRSGGSLTTVANVLTGLEGMVRLVSANGIWGAYKEDGSSINISSSTTSGLQEAITYATTVGLPLVVYGYGISSPGVQGTFISCTTGITVPPTQQWHAYFFGVNITFSSAVNGPGITFDSQEGSTFIFEGGVIVYQPGVPTSNSYAILFYPQNVTPEDHIVTITGCKFYISDIATPAIGTTGCIGFNCSLGSINTSFFASCELNGTGTGVTPNAAYGLAIFGQTSTSGFEQNIIDITNCHLYTSAGIQIGVNATNAQTLRQNIWRIGGLIGGSSSTGVSTYGSNDLFQIGGITQEQGAYSYGINAQSSATFNRFQVGSIVSPAIAPILNASHTNKFDTDGVPPSLVTVLAAGSSGTFTTKPWTRSIEIILVGGGAGGDGSGTGATSGTSGGTSTFGSLTASGGNISAGSGGGATGGDQNIQGGNGGGAQSAGSGPVAGGAGGNSSLGGAGNGISNATGGSASPGSGSGGAGGGSASGFASGAGGSAGGTVNKRITSSVAATYTYSIAAAASGGAAGTSGNAGGYGAGGVAVITEYP